MSRQLTLFGNTAQVAPYFKNAPTDYQKFVNKEWKEKHGKFWTKNNLSYVLKEWDEIKNDPIKLNAYLQSNKHAHVQRKSPFHFQTLKRLSTEILAMPSTSFLNDESNIDEATKNTSGLSIHNKTNNTTDAENLTLKESDAISSFLIDVGFTESSLFFTDDIKSDKSFINVIKSIASKREYFSELCSRYLEQSIYNLKSNLKTQLHDINIKCNELLHQLNEFSETRAKPNMNISLLSQTYLQKGQIIKEIVVTLGLLNTKMCDRDTLNNLSRHIKQQNTTMNLKDVDDE